MENSINRDSSIKMGDGNKFHGDAAIGENAKIEKHIHDSSVSYTWDKLDLTFIESLSKYVTQYNEKKISLWAGILALIGFIVDLISINSVLPNSIEMIKFIPRFNSTLGWIVLSVGSILFIGGLTILSAIQYKYDSTCPKCKENHALEEEDHPEVREIPAQDGIKKTTTRKIRCKYCDYRKEKPHTETIPYNNND